MEWLKKLFAASRQRKEFEKQLENLPTQHADMSNALPLDPKNDPWGRR